jgi:hypothetical protein
MAEQSLINKKLYLIGNSLYRGLQYGLNGTGPVAKYEEFDIKLNQKCV